MIFVAVPSPRIGASSKHVVTIPVTHFKTRKNGTLYAHLFAWDSRQRVSLTKEVTLCPSSHAQGRAHARTHACTRTHTHTHTYTHTHTRARAREPLISGMQGFLFRRSHIYCSSVQVSFPYKLNGVDGPILRQEEDHDGPPSATPVFHSVTHLTEFLNIRGRGLKLLLGNGSVALCTLLSSPLLSDWELPILLKGI
jgi:hypothetical protein